MAQKLRDDKIGTLQHNAGSIQMLASSSSPAYLTIGGQQYKVTSNVSRLIASDVVLASTTRYQVYAVVNSGVVELRISTNENSVGPSGFSRWLLLTSFYTSNVSPFAFGTFLSIDGIPESDWMTMNNTIGTFLVGVGGNPTYGGVVTNIVKGKRVGREFIFEWDFKQTSAGSTGTGAYNILCPFPVDYNYHKASNAITFVGEIGTLGVVEETSGAYAGMNKIYLPGGTTDRLGAMMSMGNGTTLLKGDWGASFSHFNVATITFGLKAKWSVIGWSNTPIKDL